MATDTLYPISRTIAFWTVVALLLSVTRPAPAIAQLVPQDAGHGQQWIVDETETNQPIQLTPSFDGRDRAYMACRKSMDRWPATPSGFAHGHYPYPMARNKVQPAAQADGLYQVGNFSGKLGAGQGWYVAPGWDYHWHRLDSNGCWSHKPGSTAARNTDNISVCSSVGCWTRRPSPYPWRCWRSFSVTCNHRWTEPNA